MRYWLVKSEPEVFSFDHLKAAPRRTTTWDGIRNYQARNYMRDEMEKGDLVLFYHSRCQSPGVVGLAEVVREAYPDHTAWDPESNYFDPKASPDNPRWCMVDLKWKKAFQKNVTLSELKADPSLRDMKVVQRGQRLSIQPVTRREFDRVCRLASG